MPDFYATYSAASNSSSTVTANQGTDPWIVAGDGVAGTPSAGVLTVQGNPSGEPIPITGAISATNPSVDATGGAVPAEATYVGMNVGGNLTGMVGTADGLKVDGSAVTQPISGTVTAVIENATGALDYGIGASTNQTLRTILATDQSAVPVSCVQDTNPWECRITDGANNATVTAGGQLLVDASGSSVSISGTVAATQSGTWNVNAVQSGGWTVTANAGSGTFTVGGTVTANAGTGTFTTDQVASTNATFQAGSIAFGALTNTYATILTATGDLKLVILRNNTNTVVEVSFDNGSTTAITLDSGDTMTLDLKTIGLRVQSGSTIQARWSGGAATAGSIRINGVY